MYATKFYLRQDGALWLITNNAGQITKNER